MRRSPAATLLLGILLFLAACGEPPSLGLSASPASVTLVPGRSADFIIELDRTATDAPVDLSVGGLPTGVTASFAPSTVPAGEGRSTLTLTAAREAALGPASLVVTAQAGEALVANIPLAVELRGLTVNGVVSTVRGLPIVGAVVRIAGHAPTATAADGTFTIADVVPPYDLVVAVLSVRMSHTYLGLTASEPRLTPFFEPLVDVTTGTAIRGALSGAGIPVPAGQQVRIVAVADQPLYGSARVSAGASTYSLLSLGAGPEALHDVRLHALQWTLAPGGGVAEYVAHGTATFTLIPGAENVVPLTLGAAPDATTLTTHRSVPAGYTVVKTGASVRLGPTSTLPLTTAATSQSSFRVPLLPGATYDTHAIAQGADGSITFAWSVDTPPGEVPELVLPVPPSLVSPAVGAADVTLETTFSVLNPAGGTVTFEFKKTDVPEELHWLTSMETRARLPDLTELGLPLASAAAWEWLAFGAPKHLTTDQAVAGDGSFGGYMGTFLGESTAGPGPFESGAMALSPRRTFQTQ